MDHGSERCKPRRGDLVRNNLLSNHKRLFDRDKFVQNSTNLSTKTRPELLYEDRTNAVPGTPGLQKLLPVGIGNTPYKNRTSSRKISQKSENLSNFTCSFGMQSCTLLLGPEHVPLSQFLCTSRKPFDEARHPERQELIVFHGPHSLMLLVLAKLWGEENISSDIVNLAGSDGDGNKGTDGDDTNVDIGGDG